MRRHLALLGPLLLLAAACGDCGQGQAPKPDASTPTTTHGCDLPGVDPKCGSPCTGDGDCPSTLYCLFDKCAADCVGVGNACPELGVCGERGRCQFTPGRDGGGGLVPDASECARVTVRATELVPTVQLLIDQSASMAESFEGVSRWEAVKKALVDPTDGVVTKLQAKVRFGATLYTNDFQDTCPDLTATDPALNNAAAVTTLLNGAAPGAETPTGEALDAVVQKLYDNRPIEGGEGPQLVVLATDGEPDTCALPNPKDVLELKTVRDVAVAAARKGFQLGVQTYVLSVGSEIAREHLQEMANAGTGTPAGNNAAYFVANAPAELVTAFDTIIRGARNCRFKLDGKVAAGQESTGQVTLNGAPLGYNDPNGWRLVDEQTLELLGTACTTFKQSDGPVLEASFACGAILPN